MTLEFRAVSMSRWKLSEDAQTLTLAFQDIKKSETHIHVPRLEFEAAISLISLDLQKSKHPDQEVYVNATGLDLGIVPDDGSVKLKFDLATGSPFCIHLPKGAAGMLLEGLKSALEGNATQNSRSH